MAAARVAGAAITLVVASVVVPARAAIRAARAETPVRVDGRIDEVAWASARPFDGFVESFPTKGAAPTQRTEVRVLYDDETLYVGVVCFDDDPARIDRQLVRRDVVTTADRIEVSFDPSRDRRNGYTFGVSASGAQRDALLYGDVNQSDSWNAVWDAAVADRPDGWSAELAIPLTAMSSTSNDIATWGMLVRRTISRTHQVFDSTMVPRDANAFVSRFGDLAGVGVNPGRYLELVPYAAIRATMRPQFSDPTRPSPRFVDPSADIGMDLRASLSRRFLLNAAVNPDFGQVEADQLLQNLSTFEVYQPEKRPFFNEGLELFQPVGSEYGAPQQMFYSRRIGLTAPILGAAKVLGAIGENLSVGVLDAVVTGVGDPSKEAIAYSDPSPSTLSRYEARPDRSLRYDLRRPFHFGANSELPAQAPVPMNYFAAALRHKLGESSRIGAMVTAATPLGPRCDPARVLPPAGQARADCASVGANAAALDWDVRTRDGDYGFLGQVDVSQRVGGSPEGAVLRDGTRLFPGDVGFGAYFRAGKLGGEPFRFDVTNQYSSPKLDLNAAGFQQTQNQNLVSATFRVVRTSGIGSLRKLSADFQVTSEFTTDGRGINRGNLGELTIYAQLPSYDYLQYYAAWEDNRFDVREIQRSGIAFERHNDGFMEIQAGLDPNRPVSASVKAFGYRTMKQGPVPSQLGYGVDVGVVVRPHSRLETRALASYAFKPQGARWLETDDNGRMLFGAQDPRFMSITLRQEVLLAPKLSVQGYFQLFSSVEHYPTFYAAQADGQRAVRFDDLHPTDVRPMADTRSASYNLSAVLRWEYRLGSTFFLVYSRAQQELGTAEGARPSTSVLPYRLAEGPVSDTVLVKWSYWFR